MGRWIHDSFVHRAAPTPGHGPESLAHIAGKLIVAEWLKTVGCAEVHVERFDTQRRRRPDVTAITRTGEAVAFEVQFTPIPVHHWRRRENDLRSGGYETIWLWGHRGLSAPASKSLEAVHREVISAGGVLWWIDPGEDALGLGYERWQIPGRKRAISTLPTGVVDGVGLRWHPIVNHDCQKTLSHRSLGALRLGNDRLRQAQVDALAGMLMAYRSAKERQDDVHRLFGYPVGSTGSWSTVDYESAWDSYRQISDGGPFGYDGEMPPPDLVGKARSEWWNRWAARRRS